MQPVTTQSEMDAAKPREFIRLLMENERRIHAYIYTLVGNHADADDLLQETSIVLWDKFDQFENEEGNFVAWAFKVAFFVCQNHRRKKGRSRVFFSEQLSKTISDKASSMSDELDSRQSFLTVCIDQLSTTDKTLLEMRYEKGASIDQTATSLGRTKQAVYKALSRVRKALSNCVDQKFALENNQ